MLLPSGRAIVLHTNYYIQIEVQPLRNVLSAAQKAQGISARSSRVANELASTASVANTVASVEREVRDYFLSGYG